MIQTPWVLHRSGIVEKHERLDRASLPRVEMPNCGGFRSDW